MDVQHAQASTLCALCVRSLTLWSVPPDRGILCTLVLAGGETCAAR